MPSGQSFILTVVAGHNKQPETLTASNASLEYVCRFQVRIATSVVHTTPIVETLTLGVLRAGYYGSRFLCASVAEDLDLLRLPHLFTSRHWNLQDFTQTLDVFESFKAFYLNPFDDCEVSAACR